MPLFRKLSTFARSPRGRRAINQALTYARGPRGQRHLRAVRDRLATSGDRRRRRT